MHTPGVFSRLITPGWEANMQQCGRALPFVETTNMVAVFFIKHIDILHYFVEGFSLGQ